jgi:hypothetical protein
MLPFALASLAATRVDTYYYSDQLYTHVQIANFVTACDTE